MAEITISLDQLPRTLRKFADQVPFAASRALNDTAFSVKKQMPTLMGDDLTLRNKYTAGGSVRVDQSDKHNLEASVGSVAWYLPRNIEGGTSRPRQGIVYKGAKYLVVPNPSRRKKSGRLKDLPKTALSKPFVVETGGELVLVIRQSFRNKVRLLPLGVLIPEAQWEAQFDWDREVDKVVGQVFGPSFVKRMVRAARTER